MHRERDTRPLKKTKTIELLDALLFLRKDVSEERDVVVVRQLLCVCCCVETLLPRDTGLLLLLLLLHAIYAAASFSSEGETEGNGTFGERVAAHVTSTRQHVSCYVKKLLLRHQLAAAAAALLHDVLLARLL